MARVISKNGLGISLTIVFLIVILTACSGARDEHDHPELQSGDDFFNRHCVECHGKDGTGKLVSQTPANILTQRGRNGIVEYITTDINPQRKMPIFAAMPYQEAEAIANHLLELQQLYDALPNNMKKPPQLLIEP